MIEEVLHKSDGLERGMKPRHLSMLAIGGTIGTGLFLGSGYVLREAGPGGSLLAYLAGGLLMVIMMASLGELVVAMPVSGSTQAYASEFVSPGMGFMAGWVRWIASAVTITSQLVASSIIMKNVFPSVPGWFWITSFTLLLFGINLFPVRKFGETEFWFAGIKVFVIVFFILAGVVLCLGLTNVEPQGLKSIQEFGFFPKGWKAILMTVMTASFAYGGVDLIASAAGESENPGKNLPRTITRVSVQMIGIYLLSLLILALVLPWNEANLQGSPFAYVLNRAGFRSAEVFINLVVVSSALSSANTFVYACTRTLWSLSKHEQAPRFLSRVNLRKVPVSALVITMGFAVIALLSSFIAADTIYLFLISSVGASNMFLYGLTCYSQYRFRKKYLALGRRLEDLKYKTPFYPMLPWVGILLYTMLVVAMAFDPTQRLALYTGIPSFLLLYGIYRMMNGNKKTTAGGIGKK